MSYVKQYWVYCDGPLCVREGTPSAFAGQGDATVAMQRRELRGRYGWKTAQPGGKDFCPECAAELAQPA